PCDTDAGADRDLPGLDRNRRGPRLFQCARGKWAGRLAGPFFLQIDDGAEPDPGGVGIEHGLPLGIVDGEFARLVQQFRPISDIESDSSDFVRAGSYDGVEEFADPLDRAQAYADLVRRPVAHHGRPIVAPRTLRRASVPRLDRQAAGLNIAGLEAIFA